IMEHLTANGKAGVIVPEGIIFQTANAYKGLRKILVEDNYLVGVISLPAGVFNPYSGVKTSILWIDKSLARKTDKIIFLKVNNDGYNLGAQRKAITENDLPDIFAHTLAYKKALLRNEEFSCEDERVSLVKKSRLAEGGDFNLSAGRYEKRDKYISVFVIVNLSEVAKIISGQSPPGRYYNENGDGLPFYQGKSEFTEMYLGEAKKWTSEVTKKAQKNDIVMSVRAPVGPVNIVTNDICIGRGLAAIRCSDRINHMYCFYVLKHLEDQITGNAGSTFGSINRNDISEIKIPLPSHAVQEEIVAELDSYQKIIDSNRELISIYEQRIQDRIECLWKS
ncbi:MAG: N-6 DNA methylase, partial [Bacteroidales bacterium]|nr:N-6 DNA methylase [Bacteroidales bacterium]